MSFTESRLEMIRTIENKYCDWSVGHDALNDSERDTEKFRTAMHQSLTLATPSVPDSVGSALFPT